MKTNRDYSAVQAFIQRLLAKLGENTGPVIDRGLMNESYMDEVVEKMVDCGYQPNRAQLRAEQIMGSNMFGIRDAIETFGVYPSREQLSRLAVIKTPKGRIITETELKQCKNTHILVAVFRVWPLAVTAGFLHNHMFYTASSHRLFHEGNFSINLEEEGWYLIRKTGTPKSANKEFIEQIQILGLQGEIPKMHTFAYAMVGHFVKTDERLFIHQSVRCATDPLQRPGSRITIGFRENDGLWLGETQDSEASKLVVLASMQPQ